MPHLLPMYPHQAKALDALGNGKVLAGQPGSGKSRVAIEYYMRREAPRDVYVITTAKKRDTLDWEGEAAAFGIGKDVLATTQGVLCVDSWNNIEKYLHIEDAFFIFDEQRVVGKGSWAKTFIKIAKKNRWILLTGTPGDTWLDYIPVFVANGFYKNRTEFNREHVVYSYYGKFPKVEKYTGVGRLVRHRNDVLVEMPFQRHTTRHHIDVLVEHDVDLFRKVVKERWNPYEERPLRDAAELFSQMRKVVNSDFSRLEAVRALAEKHDRLIVFYNFDYELEALRTLPMVKCPGSKSPSSTRPSSTTTSSDGLSTQETSSGTSPTSSTSSKPSSLTDSTKPWSPSAKDPSSSGPATSTSSEEQADAGKQSQGKATSSDGTSLGSSTLRASMGSTGPTNLSTEDSSRERTGSVPTAPQTTRATGDPSTTPAPSTSLRTTSRSRSKTSSSTSSPSSSSSETAFTIAEWNGHKHEPIPKTDRWVYLVQYVAGAEGWNCIETDAMVFYSLTYSYKNFEQARGRIDRLNTPFEDLWYYVLRSNSLIDKAVWKALSSKKSFNEASFRAKVA